MLWRARVILLQLKSDSLKKGGRCLMTIKELRQRSNQFVADLDSHIAAIVDHNERLLQLNKGQLKSSQTSEGKPLVNSRTGSPRYSPAYAKRKGYSYPDLFLTGRTYKEMDIYTQEPDQYVITSFSDVTKYLVVFFFQAEDGIRDKAKARAIVIPMLRARYEQLVLR